MKPKKLTLQGFTGITSGLGKDSITLDLSSIPHDKRLVALVGPNGNGKTTLLDNMHPYRVMPSRSTTLGPGGFSYWNHLCTPTAQKELDWEHDGRQFRTTFFFKVSGKTKKADYYLFELDTTNQWAPACLPDGTLSDGKAETYDQCVDAILGPPERFFTSQFSAQKRRALSDYGATEVKALLASILNLVSYRALSAKASLVGKLLRNSLDELNDQLSQARGADDGIAEVNSDLATLEARELEAANDEQRCSSAQTEAKQALLALEAKRDALAKDVEQAAFLTAQIKQAIQNGDTAKSKLSAAAATGRARMQAELTRTCDEVRRATSAIAAIDAELHRLTDVMANRDAIHVAAKATPIERQRIVELDACLDLEQQKLSALGPIREQLNDLIRKQAEFNTAGQGKRIAIAKLEETGSLVREVPCRDSELQKQCPLLGQAQHALGLVPGEMKLLDSLRSQYRSVTAEVKQLEERVATSTSIELTIQKLTLQRTALTANLHAMVLLAARGEVLEQAEKRLPELAESKAQHHRAIESSRLLEAQQKLDMADIAAKLATEMSQVEDDVVAEVQKLKERLSRLSAPVTEAELMTAQQAVLVATNRIEVARAKAMTMSNQKIGLLAKRGVHQANKERTKATLDEAERLKEEIAKYKLLEKGLGNDGLIALSIDDAGPEISRLCNELLVEDYEGRFAVRLDTQRETLGGDLRETFAIKVFDSRGGEEKSLDDMSGGEQVWVNECLTRAIALYVSNTSGMRYQTLFTDEADGALDPEKKRQFMQMKLSVLKRGGYEREYFISQTPELWEMADHIIHMDQF